MGTTNLFIGIIMDQWDILMSSRTVAAAIFCAGVMISFFVAKFAYRREISILKAMVSSLQEGKNINKKVAKKRRKLSKKNRKIQYIKKCWTFPKLVRI